MATLYDYPDASYSRPDGKSLFELEEEIMAGGPHQESRIGRIYKIAEDKKSPLHFIAVHYLNLSFERAQHWKLEKGQSLMPLPWHENKNDNRHRR